MFCVTTTMIADSPVSAATVQNKNCANVIDVTAYFAPTSTPGICGGCVAQPVTPGGASLRVCQTFITQYAVPSTHTAALPYLQIPGIEIQNPETCHSSLSKTNCQMPIPTSSTQLIGSRYFRQTIMTWSIRSRGSVQRTHIMMNTPNHPLRMKTCTFTRLPSTQPMVCPL